MQTLQLGDIRIDRVQDWVGPLFEVASFFPDSDWASIEEQRDWLEPHFLKPRDIMTKGFLDASLHTFVVRTSHHNILIDTCVGNHKERSILPDWSMMDTNYLGKIAALGLSPEDIDFVMCTHLHVDHVGWNTKLDNGRWVPTFPNARYIFHRSEYDHWLDNRDHHGMDGAFDDSVLPVVEAGRADLVAGDYGIDDSIWLEPSPGHTPGHVCINVVSKDASGLFTGDSFHHPVQIAYPEWSTAFCSDIEQSAIARRTILDRLVDTDTYILAAHFADPTVARVVGNGQRCKLGLNELP
jgi:glyoxylase-like metal-dependent hydrolase (beta-lactamase superfamily II)